MKLRSVLLAGGLALLSGWAAPAAADLTGGGGVRSTSGLRLVDRFGMAVGGGSVIEGLRFDAGLAATAAEPVPIFGVSLSAVVESESVLLTWELVDGSEAAGFFVEKSPRVDGAWTRLTATLLSAEVRSFRDAAPSAGSAWYRLGAIDRQGSVTLAGPIEVSAAPPSQWMVAAPFPNPFAAAVTLSFELPEPAEVALQIFDVRGRRLAEPFLGDRPAGRHALTWDGSTPAGPAAAGIYFLRLTAGRHEEWRKVVISR